MHYRELRLRLRDIRSLRRASTQRGILPKRVLVAYRRPVPVRGIIAGLLVKSLPIVSSPTRDPVVAGVKVTLTLQLLPCGRGEEEMQSSVSE